MDMEVVTVVVPIDEIGVVFHLKPLHVAVGDFRELFVGQFFGRMEIEGGVQHFDLRTGVELI